MKAIVMILMVLSAAIVVNAKTINKDQGYRLSPAGLKADNGAGKGLTPELEYAAAVTYPVMVQASYIYQSLEISRGAAAELAKRPSAKEKAKILDVESKWSKYYLDKLDKLQPTIDKLDKQYTSVPESMRKLYKETIQTRMILLMRQTAASEHLKKPAVGSVY